MPKYRQLHTKIIDSFDFNEMPDDFTRLTWVLLSLILDSEGRGIDNPTWLKSKLFPLRADVTNDMIGAAFNFFSSRGMVQRYSVAGRNYFFVPTFKQYQTGTQKEADSLLPAPVVSEVTPELLPTNSVPTPEQGRVAVYASASASESEYASESELNGENEFLSKLDVYVGVPIGGTSDIDTAKLMLEEYGLERVKRSAAWVREKKPTTMTSALRSMNTALRNGGFHDKPPAAAKTDSTDSLLAFVTGGAA